MLNTYFVARAAAQSGLKVALSGLGGDELFAGYPSFRQVPRIVGALGRVPAAARLGRGLRVVVGAVPQALHVAQVRRAAGVRRELRRRVPAAARDVHAVGAAGDHRTRISSREGWRELATLARLEATLGGIANGQLRVSALEATWYMRNQLLRDTDWASMAHGVEVRVPLVDWTLWQRVAPLVGAMRQPGKLMMAGAVRPSLPPRCSNRNKTGFMIPARDWMLNEPRGYDAERGLRGWARYVVRGGGMRVLALVTDAFGGRGGIAKFNRDMLARTVRPSGLRGSRGAASHHAGRPGGAAGSADLPVRWSRGRRSATRGP